MPRVRTLAVHLFLAGAAAAAAIGPSGTVISQVQGEATLLAAGAAGEPARPLQMVATGATLRLSPGAQVLVLCSGDRAVRLSGPVDWLAGPDACAKGKPLAPGTYARLVPAAGRVRSFHGNLLEEAASRGDDGTGKVPVILSPHSPQRRAVLIASPQPAIAWLEVKGALSYDLLLEGDAARPPVTIAADRAACQVDARGTPARVCTAPWPWPPLAAGRQAELRIEALTADPDWRLRKSDVSRLQLADSGLRSTIKARLAALAGGDLPAATGELLRASIYAEAGLFNESAAALRASLQALPDPALTLRLADLDLGLGLLRPALNEYGRAEQMLTPHTGGDETRAALYLGLGRLYARREDGATAAGYLDRAARLFDRLGWSDEAATATAEAARARRGPS